MCTLGMAGIFPSLPEGPSFNIACVSNRSPFLLVYQRTNLCKMLGEHKKKGWKTCLECPAHDSQVSHHAGEMVQNCGLLLAVIALFIK